MRASLLNALCVYLWMSVSGCGQPPATSTKIHPKPSAVPAEKAAAEEKKPEIVVPKVNSSGDTSVATPVAPSPVPETVISRDLTDSGARFQVKRLTLLRASIENCLGSNVTRIAESMFIADNPVNMAGRVRFFTPGKYVIGSDILDIEKSNLEGRQEGTRTVATADGIEESDSYLRSLGIVADVVAHNCDFTTSNCKCSTEETALAMLQRCLPNVDPSTIQFKDVAASFSKTCSAGEYQNRKAIASLISSYAFAQAR
jgi:hypothetical protein